VTGRLTTHVLDTANGIPASGVAVTLFDAAGAEVARGTTNADGRLEAPILAGDRFAPGRYTLAFEVGDYYRRLGASLAEPAFLDTVVVSFGLAEAAHYHVPLLVSPYGYSTYRGS
jgi:5-hydroxyisourate hydrolase